MDFGNIRAVIDEYMYNRFLVCAITIDKIIHHLKYMS